MKTDEMFVYLGTYTSGEGEGIYLCRLDIEDGSLSTPELVAEMDNPTFLAIHPNERYLYAVSEVRKHGERKGGAVSAFQRDAVSGSISILNSQPSGGSGPCHLNIDAAGRCLLVANYGSGSVSAFPLAEDGRLGEASAFFQHEGSSVNPQRQTGPHAHSANLSPDNRFVFICDLGLDRIMVYRLDAEKSMLTPAEKPWVEVAAGAGPRHFTFHPSGRSAYVINELDSTITAFSYASETGELQEIETVSTLPEGFAGESTTAEVLVSRDGRFLYGSNRGHDSMANFCDRFGKRRIVACRIRAQPGKDTAEFRVRTGWEFTFGGASGLRQCGHFPSRSRDGPVSANGRSGECADAGLCPVREAVLKWPESVSC